MKTWSFYDEKSGLLIGARFSGPDSSVDVNTPAGFKAIEGTHDHLASRVDIETGALIDYQPPQPSPDHVWRDRRWVLSDEASARIAAKASAKARIRELEGRQARAVREATLGQDGAADRLQAIDDEIAQLRQVING